MRKLLVKLILISLPIILALYYFTFLLPPSASQKKFLLYALPQKNLILDTTSSQRLIFVGGSNLSFGLDSKKIKDSLKLNPINTGLHAGLGLKFMLKNVEPYIQKNDIVILCPEYEHFFGNYRNGNIELLTTVIDVLPESTTELDFEQIITLVPLLPKYAQMKISEHLFPSPPTDKIGIYDKESFNEYGDAIVHWTLPCKKVYPYEQIDGSFNYETIELLENFCRFTKSKKASTFILFPCIQESGYQKFISKIKEIEEQIGKSNLKTISKPERYIFKDEMMFNSQYHLNKKGVDVRTEKILEDLKKIVYY